MKLKKNQAIPKGSYHSFCRKLYNIDENQQNQRKYFKNIRKRDTKSVISERIPRIDEFDTFEDYMNNFKNEQETERVKRVSKTVSEMRKNSQIKQRKPSSTLVLKERESDRNVNRSQSKQKGQKSSRNNFRQKYGADEIVGAFLPFFKIKLDKINQAIQLRKDFKMNSRKFRIKSSLIEQNKLISEKWGSVI